jgi:hypothetical protein
VLAVTADKMLKSLKHARLDHTDEAALRKLLAVDLLMIDDFGLDALDPTESRDTYEVLIERHRAGSIVVTSNRGPDEWLATFADPLRAQSATDRFVNNAYELTIDGESYRTRQTPSVRSPWGKLVRTHTRWRNARETETDREGPASIHGGLEILLRSAERPSRVVRRDRETRRGCGKRTAASGPRVLRERDAMTPRHVGLPACAFPGVLLLFMALCLFGCPIDGPRAPSPGGIEPPDSQVAAGPNHIMVVTNLGVQGYDRAPLPNLLYDGRPYPFTGCAYTADPWIFRSARLLRHPLRQMVHLVRGRDHHAGAVVLRRECHVGSDGSVVSVQIPRVGQSPRQRDHDT